MVKEVDDFIVQHRLNGFENILSVNYTKHFGKSWIDKLESVLTSSYMTNLNFYLNEAYKNKSEVVYPKVVTDIYKPWKSVNFDDVKVVIFDDEPASSPYVNGLAFGEYVASSGRGPMTQKSAAVEKCIANSYADGYLSYYDTTMEDWAAQGVMLINESLISSYGLPAKHKFMFRNLIRQTIIQLNKYNVGVVYVFTSKAQHYYEKFIDKDFNYIIKTDGITQYSEIFGEINDHLTEHATNPSEAIEWTYVGNN